ncbi:hypothetical protein [Catenulispora sp. MAP12-49]|uniref:hypothetical protein n=1 Tax=Catenulispora sp. MAP12-49 TaxID=3156302 RepID=UPI0035170A50
MPTASATWSELSIVHASLGRVGAAALVVAAAALLVDVPAPVSADVVAAVSGVLDAAPAAVLVGAAALCAVELAAEEHPAKPRTSAAVITWYALSLLFMADSPPARVRDLPR